MRRALLAALLALAPVAAQAQGRSSQGGSAQGEAESYARTVLSESSADACVLRLDVAEVLGRQELAIRGNPFVMASLRATLRDPRPGPRNANPGACGAAGLPGGLPPGPQELLVMFPPARVAPVPAPGEAIEVVADAVPGFAPYGVGGGVLLAYVRRAVTTR